ncbi:MAG: winged helix-turn-helix transcriptional regulator [Ruminococcus sp.]|nr:winged helix-turn-helix transcriptional regulator [Ruminococcus sp.]MBP3797185.1 winged helix-turn-helix transcriptional regulator [Ruminococcus sp.]MBQ1433591.1 winged helix-turn-helix transcriptional regulator [Ruminococcus sp.]
MRDERKAEILISSKHIHQRIENIISARLAHNDITAAQSHVLMFVMSCDAPVYASDIQKKMNISGATVTGLLKKLRANGYITMEGCDTDERRRRIIVTEKAHTHRAEICSCMSAIEDEAFKGFSEEQINVLLSLTKRMAENLSAYKGKERDK